MLKILFVLAMVAEEESHMKSEAMLLSLEWRFSRGRFLTPALLGYDRVEIPDGFGGHRKVLQINEDEGRKNLIPEAQAFRPFPPRSHNIF